MRFFFIFIIRFYQLFISPFFAANCRFNPTCSQYAIEAIKKYGIICGTKIASKRITKCHPWGDSGYDPVP